MPMYHPKLAFHDSQWVIWFQALSSIRFWLKPLASQAYLPCLQAQHGVEQDWLYGSHP